MSLLPKKIRLQFEGLEWLRSATDDLFFRASISAECRSGRSRHENLSELAKTNVLETASKIARQWEVDQWYAAQDAINARLGEPRNCNKGFYKKLVAKVVLFPDKDAIQAAARIRADRARISHLTYLKAMLYSDPTLLAIEYLEKHDNEVKSIDFDQFRRFSETLKAGENWWGPLMHAWNELASNADSTEAVGEAMKILLDAVYRLDSKLAIHYNLPRPDSRDLMITKSTKRRRS